MGTRPLPLSWSLLTRSEYWLGLCVFVCVCVCVCVNVTFAFVQEWYVALVKSQCCLRGDGALTETTELLTKLPPTDLSSIMSCKVTHTHPETSSR